MNQPIILELKLPVFVHTWDYHDFTYMQQIYRQLDEKICVTEVSYDAINGVYKGLVHTGTKEELDLVFELEQEYKKSLDE